MIDYTFIPAQTFEEATHNLYHIVTMLRSPDGCPWDRAQSNESTLANLIDEAYEYLDAIKKNDIDNAREEIGDVTLNAFLLLETHDEKNDFSPIEALNEVCEKLVRRHTHVFGKETADNPEEVLTLWNKNKDKEKGRQVSADNFFTKIPSSLPPLEESYEIQKKLAKVGFDWPDNNGIFEKVREELGEVEDALAEGNHEHLEEELGDLLTAVVNLCRFNKVRPNIALHLANEKMKRRFLALFTLAQSRGIPLDNEHAREMNLLWDEIKKDESSRL